MRLAIFWHDLLHYHVARIRGIVKAADAKGHTVQAYILCSTSSELPSYNYMEGLERSIKILSNNPAEADKFSYHSKRHLLSELDDFNPDTVVIIGYTGLVSRAALGWCRYHRKGAILMLSSHAADYARVWWKEWLKQRLISLYDAAFVSGQRQGDYAHQLGMPSDRIIAGYGVVDNDFWQTGAELARTNAISLRTQYSLPERYFLTACRFVAKKNLDGLLRSYAQYVAKSESTPYSLVIVGDGELMPSLREQVSQLDLDRLVHFLGYLPADEMTKIYGLASAFVLASSHAEQWGLVVNEAMASALPVLVSNICGCVPDLVQDGETGFVFDPKSEANLTNLLLHLSFGEVDLKVMGHNGQRKIQHFSPRTFAENLFTIAEIAILHAENQRWSLWPSPSLWR